jgi:2-amino-4-hydroxy-6-hydroxymethyldihydropteridine diphosphokinase/dihydropteroate synthase
MVILGLGSNLGNRAIHLRRAIARLSRGSGAVLRAVKLSRIYESPALMPPEALSAWDLPYLNCALSGDTTLEPGALLRHVQDIERSLGREDHDRWAPRVIDIDILWWTGREVRSGGLTLPHPELLKRTFVLEPLRDLIPDILVEGETIEKHASRLKAETSVREPLGSNTRTQRALESSVSTLHTPAADFEVGSPTLMGILNVTPDSFSDGGRFAEPEIAMEHASRLVEAGAGIIDVGAESTRPGAAPLDPQIEWERVEPVLRGLRAIQQSLPALGSGGPFQISLDSRNSSTVRSALKIGVDILNDVTGFRGAEMLEVAAETDVPLVFMHSLSVPATMRESIPTDPDAVEFLITWARTRLAEFDSRGIARHRLIFDPGIGFGKTIDQSWHILKNVERFHDLELPLLIGHSRKSFLESVTGKLSRGRDDETLKVSRGLATRGVDILRVHDVKGHTELFRSDDPTL